jgi:hypothetical protein
LQREYRKSKQTGSKALQNASCDNPNETWLPLLEKAYAKVHGDYTSISDGNPGVGVEDLTGGVNFDTQLNKVLNKDKLWNELQNAEKEFLFSTATSGANGNDRDQSDGIPLGHAYSILRAVEETSEKGEKVRLLLIRNPWGSRIDASRGEWIGAWSDGSKEWSPYWLNKLNYQFGDDGLFWISYEDFFRKFELLKRTRLFDSSWKVSQQWTNVSVSYITGYMTAKFEIEVKTSGVVVIVLSQVSLDIHASVNSEN